MPSRSTTTTGVVAEAEPGTFYLTDFLLRNYQRLVVKPLGLDRHPELRDAYFGNYRRLLYLAQAERPGALAAAGEVAASLGLQFAYHFTGYGVLGTRLAALLARPAA